MQGLVVAVPERCGVDFADLGQHLTHQILVHHLLIALCGVQLAIGAGLVDEVNGFVGQKAVGDIFCRCSDRFLYGLSGISHVMVVLIPLLQSLQDLDGLVDRRFFDVYLLEAPQDTLGRGQPPLQLVVGSGTDEANVSGLKIGLEHIRCVYRSIATSSRADDVVHLVHIDDGVAFFARAFHHFLDTLLEIAAVLRAGQHRAHVHRVDAAVADALRYLTFVDAVSEPIDERRFADAGFADVQRVVLVFSAKHLYGALQFCLASDQRIVVRHIVVDARHPDMPVGRLLV